MLVLLGMLGSSAIGVAAGTAAAPKPVIVSLTTSPREISASGGRVVISVRARGASRCTFRGQSGPFTALRSIRTSSCSSGRASVAVTISPNRHQSAATIQYYVRLADTSGREVQRGVTVAELAAATPSVTPPSTPQPAPVPALSIVTSSLASATVGVPYAATLTATGGTPPYVWSVVSGSPPPGVSVSSGGAITGTPTTSGQTSLTVQVSDSTAGGAKTATATLSISVAAPSTTASLSTNWAGYYELGGPFTAVTGTFNVPNLTTALGSTTTAEWVGIDGAVPTDTSLIQAGVTESYDPSTNLVHLHAWWEILPAIETPIALSVVPGNTITVSIGQVSAGLWQISITNVSTGQTFTTQQSFTGAGTTAEWIVEAPTTASTGSLATLGQYSPNVTFSNPSATGAETSLTATVMIQGGVIVSEPSAFTPGGFTVAYGSQAPTPPA